MKKKSNLQELMGYAGGHRYLTYLSLLLSAVSAVLALFPFVFLFRIIQEVIAVAPDYAQATHIVHNGWMAVGFAVASIVVYVCALMSSHLSAFRIAGNIRKALMAHIAELPLGFAAMFKMAGPSMAEDMKLYQNALADMNNEAAEYVRGVPVVKTFGQTVHSFKRSKGTIEEQRTRSMM